jgi:hypothetical protein
MRACQKICAFFRCGRYNSAMLDAKQNLDQYFPEMRWRCLSLAADLDRISRSNDAQKFKDDNRLITLRRAIGVLLDDSANRAERVQMLFSDTTPPPSK